MSTDNLPCRSCQTGSSMTHCTICCEGIGEGERIYECRACLNVLNDSPRVCEACMPLTLDQHMADHEWLSTIFLEVDAEDERACETRCDDCEEEISIFHDTKSTHLHKNYVVEMGPLERQRRAHRQFRRCPRSPVRHVQLSDDECHVRDLNCGCCHQRFAKDVKVFFCLKCDFLSCTGCYDSGITNHPHTMFGTWLHGSIPPDDFWKDLVTGENTRQCDACQDSILARIETHLRCRECHKYDVCQDCINDETSVTYHDCGIWPEMDLFDPKDMGHAWLENQLAQARQHTDAPLQRDADANITAAQREDIKMAFLQGSIRVATRVLKAENTFAGDLNRKGAIVSSF